MNGDKPKITYFTDLNTWKEGHKLVLVIYKTTDEFPSKEQFGLTNQLNRAAVSITSNLAEGFSRSGYKDKVRFYFMALGSLTEVQNQILIARDLKYINSVLFNKINEQTIVVHKLINGLIKSSRKMLT